MRRRRRWFPLLLLLVITAVILWFIFRPPATEANFGPAVALCPGPDLYGYTCTNGGGFSYIDATIGTELRQLDGTTPLQLPFPFTFYGTTYTAVQVSSNGNMQFGNANPAYVHQCLTDGPASAMGDMIAPYWTDLDLTFAGSLDYDVVGDAPNRIFVVEWDSIPPFGSPAEETVTFSVQLFEGSNDIVMLYADTTTIAHSNGRSAAIGIQSENQGVALQLGCNQSSVADASRLHIVHPEAANDELGQTAVISTHNSQNPPDTTTAREPLATLLEQLNLHGTAVLQELERRWYNESPRRFTEWQWVDLNNNGRSDLIILWHGGQQHPEYAELAVLTLTNETLTNETLANEQYRTLYHQRLSTRARVVTVPTLLPAQKLTSDLYPDVLIRDVHANHLFVLTGSEQPQLHIIPGLCRGSFGLLDVNNDQQIDIVRDGCETPGRRVYSWNDTAFDILPPQE
ncbi:MAG: hypothetical protein AAF614_24325 [Chloroflexota bacterium]